MIMPAFPSLVSIADALGHALFTGVWLGVLLAIVLAVAAERLRATNAATRHAMWYAALLSIAIVPAVSLAWSFDHAITLAPSASRSQLGAWRPPAGSASKHTSPAASPQRSSTAADSRTAQDAKGTWTPASRPFDATPYLLGALAIAVLGALIGVGGIGLSLVRLLAVKNASRPFDPAIEATLRRWSSRPAIGREVALRVSQGLDVPAAVGFFSPAILVPASWPANLDVDELDSIVMHEYSHLRRCDDWWALFQRIAERAYWFNPALRFIASRSNLEREIACDDWVVTDSSNATSYAECLWRIAQFAHIPHPKLPVPAALVTRAQIVERIEHLMDDNRDSLPHVRPTALLAIVPVAALLLLVGVVRAPAVTLTMQATVAAPATVAVKPKPVVAAAPSRIAHPAARSLTGPKSAAQPRQKAQASVDVALAHEGSQVASSGLDVRSLLEACQGCDLSGKDLRNADLHGLRLSGFDMSRTDLRGANLRDTRFEGVDLSGARLDNADLTGAEFSGADIRNVSWTGANLTNTKFQGVTIDQNLVRSGELRRILASCEGCDLSRLNLSGQDLSGVRLEGADLSDTDLSGTNLSHATLDGVDLKNSRLNGTNLTNATLNGCDLTGVDLRQAKIQGLKLEGADLRGMHFSGLDMRGLTADGADLSGTTLSHIDFSGVKMDGSDFSNSDLTYANLTNGDFSGADFRQARLDNANLQGAALCGYGTFTDQDGVVVHRKKECADLMGATTQGADFRGVRICDDSSGTQSCALISAADLRALSHSDLTGAIPPNF